MALQRINPANMGAEPASYSQGIVVPAGAQTLYIAGQIGVDASGAVSPDFARQCKQTWSNLLSVLEAAGMKASDLVKTTAFLVNPADYAAFAEIRKEILGTHKPASTLVYVSALVKPEWKVEIEAVAVRG
jgi:enamine deaminase RidA (YjgF/YER057c/UK114 family)